MRTERPNRRAAEWARWLRMGVALTGTLAKAALAILIVGGVAAGASALTGGTLGVVSVMAEWRALTPALLSGIAHAAALAFICDRLGGVLQTLAEGDPFVPENARRLRQVAIALAALEVSRYAIQGLTAAIIAVAGHPAGAELSVRFAPSVVAWGAVVVLFVLAHVFGEGARLRHRDQLTI
jgi:hypothetical protein